MTKRVLVVKLSLAFAMAGAAWAAQAQPSVNVTVGGVIKPGVYGRVEIGTQPPPPVIYPQPVIITQPVIVVQPGVVVQQQPIYMNVPPGHAKKWSKHCYKYNACNQPVYFVRNDYRGDKEDREDREERRGKEKKHGKRGDD